uniref:PID domain-containing protein n=1 Tax=Fundulus heteroclitus TaxID=8078 RepID=A0A3Q2P7F3_FUNHE
MTETEQTYVRCPAPGQTAVRTWPPYRTTGPFSDTRSRFEGDGVRYKAKLIGMDPVPQAQGEKMCLDSMMKLKGFEAAARKQGKHKMRIWLKISSSGLKILDERTGIVLHDQDRTRISSLTKDMSDPRALAYIYKHEDVFILFYIKTANQIRSFWTSWRSVSVWTRRRLVNLRKPKSDMSRHVAIIFFKFFFVNCKYLFVCLFSGCFFSWAK